MALIPCVAIRGTTGISVSQGPPSYEPVSSFVKDDSKNCKAMAFSPQGNYFAWTNGVTIKIVSCQTWHIVCQIQRPKVYELKFSPQDTYLMTWEFFTVSQTNPDGAPNLCFWDPKTGELKKSWVHKTQLDWAPQWSSDEKVCGLLVNNAIQLYENLNFDVVANRVNIGKIANYSIAPQSAPCNILCYLPGKAGQPSFGKLFQYPNFKVNQLKASKSFFQADKVDMYWNKQGTSVLLMTSTEIDKTGASYYGKQTLHYLDSKGETAMVMLSKEGPIHAVEWSPRQSEFCVIYGLMPSKATLFNHKCESIFEFGTKHRNSLFYNPQGNILILTGFGNLRGDVELWDTINKKLIATSSAPDTTLLEWSPDGEHYMTATTAPRLRMSNGFKIWHYTGTLLYERPWNKQEELWEVTWQKYPLNSFKEKPISYKAVEGIAPSQPQAVKQAYRPPSARGTTSTFKLHDEIESESKSNEANASKAALNKKKRDAKKAKKDPNNTVNQSPNLKCTSNGQPSSTNISKPVTSIPAIPEITNDPEKLKKIKKIKVKLDQITKLKEQQQMGKQLEINQLDKIKKEEELTKELQELIL